MDNIEKVRAKISMYDDEIIKILSKRMDCIDEIMEYKKEKGMPILQPEYEGKKEIALCKKLKDNKYQDEIMNIFRYVVKNAKKYQAKNLFPYNIMLIGFMGSGKSTIAKYLSHILEMQDLLCLYYPYIYPPYLIVFLLNYSNMLINFQQNLQFKSLFFKFSLFFNF